MGLLTSLWHLAEHIYLQVFIIVYVTFQNVLSLIFAPTAPPPKGADALLHRPRIAIIGAGLTGVSAASHCVGHGCDVKIFETRPKDKGLGGIWSVCPSSAANVSARADHMYTARQLDLGPSSAQRHVPIPSIRKMGERVPDARTDQVRNNQPLEAIQPRKPHGLQHARGFSRKKLGREMDYKWR